MSDILLALAVDLELAENLFSHRAKLRVNSIHSPRTLSTTGVLAAPTWVHSASLVIEPAMDSKFIEQEVDGMIDQLVAAIERTTKWGGSSIVFPESCRVSIHKMGASLYNFSIRQSWSIGFNSEEDAKRIFGGRGK